MASLGHGSEEDVPGWEGSEVGKEGKRCKNSSATEA